MAVNPFTLDKDAREVLDVATHVVITSAGETYCGKKGMFAGFAGNGGARGGGSHAPVFSLSGDVFDPPTCESLGWPSDEVSTIATLDRMNKRMARREQRSITEVPHWVEKAARSL